MPSLRSFSLAACLVASMLVLATGCEIAPPVQEMSDARQAIAVARDAGAETHAADQLREAVQYLETAEQKLNEESYAEARRAALAAKSKALTARRLSEINKPE
ncbi:MAG: DUF4398 domain-containing protein [Woeseiaceae bacterium]|nr:DUF4398 domain-containing protein [Woeseiaceae bacterium]